LKLHRTVLGDELLQRRAQLVAQRIPHEVRQPVAALLELLGDEVIEHIRVRETSRRRPAVRLQVLHECGLDLLRQLPVTASHLLDHLAHHALGAQEIADRLLEFALLSVRLAQAAGIEIQQTFLAAPMIRQLPLEIAACFDEM
jgi:hypothetical protein